MTWLELAQKIGRGKKGSCVDIWFTDVYLGTSLLALPYFFLVLLVDNRCIHCVYVTFFLIIFEGDNQEFARKIMRQR